MYIAGHTGLVGSALVRHFATREDVQVICAPRAELDLTKREAVEEFLARQRPDLVIVAAGRVGGIAANAASPAQFIYENVMIEANLIHGTWKAGVKRSAAVRVTAPRAHEKGRGVRRAAATRAIVMPTAPYATTSVASVP